MVKFSVPSSRRWHTKLHHGGTHLNLEKGNKKVFRVWGPWLSVSRGGNLWKHIRGSRWTLPTKFSPRWQWSRMHQATYWNFSFLNLGFGINKLWNSEIGPLGWWKILTLRIRVFRAPEDIRSVPPFPGFYPPPYFGIWGSGRRVLVGTKHYPDKKLRIWCVKFWHLCYGILPPLFFSRQSRFIFFNPQKLCYFCM